MIWITHYNIHTHTHTLHNLHHESYEFTDSDTVVPPGVPTIYGRVNVTIPDRLRLQGPAVETIDRMSQQLHLGDLIGGAVYTATALSDGYPYGLGSFLSVEEAKAAVVKWYQYWLKDSKIL